MLVLLALIIALLAAILLAAQVAEAQRGGGGGGRGGGGVGKPSSGSSSKPSDVSKGSAESSSTGNTSGYKSLPPGVADTRSPYFNSPRYGLRHNSLSNFFLWSWLLHDRDNDEYEEEYIQPNNGAGGWFVTALGLAALVGITIWALRRRAKR